MRKISILILFAAFAIVSPAFADEMSDLKAQMQELTQTVKDLKNVVEAQQKEISVLKTSPSQVAAPVGTATQEQIDAVNEKVDQVVEAQKKVLPSEFNPAIGLVGETVISNHDHDSTETGSDRPGGVDVFQRSTELNIASSVDPFATAYAVINASADPVTGEAALGVEEAAMQSTSLPWNLTAKGGRFFGEFGRLAYIHDHELPFVNRPLVLDQYIGGESQTDGAQLSWLVPIDHYVNLTAGVGQKFGDGQNNPGLSRNMNELNYFGRASTYFDLPSDLQIETGISGLYNPRTDDLGGALAQPNGSTLTETARRLYGADFSLRWVPLKDNQFRGVTWGTEVLYSDNDYIFDPDATPGTADEFKASVDSMGLYSYITYKIDRQWSVGGLYEYVENAQNEHDQTNAYSGYLTYNLSHWSQLRLQFTHTDRDEDISGLKDDNAVYLQWSWIIGSHSHGWQQR